MTPQADGPLKVGVISLGCPKNQVDTERMLGRFIQQGYELTSDPEVADLLVVNTCGFVADAEAESREAIEEMAAIKARHPGKRLLVTGCLSQRYGDDLIKDHPSIDLSVGANTYETLIPLIQQSVQTETWSGNQVTPVTDFTQEETVARVLTTHPQSAYLKIAEGCNNPCAFCIIPQLRGPFRSRTPEDLRAEVQMLVSGSVRELNLVSQDTTLYGRDLNPRTDLAALVRDLDTVDELAWIRLLYLYPTLMNEALIQTVAQSERVVPYFDIPLQHSHSDVLKRMKRAERYDDLVKLIQLIRKYMPEAVIRTTFIVGFPGETQEEFDHLYQFVEQTGFDHMGVFTYSDEPGTTAFDMADKVPQEVAEQRMDRLMTLQQGISAQRLAGWVGETVPVLVEGIQEDEQGAMLVGRSWFQAPEVDGQVFITDGEAASGDIVAVTITESLDYDLVGIIAEAAE
ncbi:MAG: 30S ribosomal protein S12 methylthiotransferase RimO [Magnetococcales bacterium]|nr:30S ribosomal protein S12 methylthiotransferase RimO [Magnetococcales bacterium]